MRPLLTSSRPLRVCQRQADQDLHGRHAYPRHNGSKTIAIKRVASTLSKGAEVGAIQGGLACVGQRRLQWSQAGQLASGPEQLYTDRIRDEFRGAGYNIAPTATENTSGLALFQDTPRTGISSRRRHQGRRVELLLPVRGLWEHEFQLR